MAGTYILLGVAFVFVNVLTFSPLHASCPYDNMTNTVDLSKAINPKPHLTKADLNDCPSKATSLILSHNSIQSLSSDVFDGFWALTSITIAHNLIETLPTGLLKNMRSLTHFDVSDNALEALKDSLFFQLSGVPLTNLVAVNFSHNNISDIGFNVFHKDMSSILNVDLSFNRLPSLEPWPYIPQTDQSDSEDVIWNFQNNSISSFTNNMNWTYDLVEQYEFEIQLQNNSITAFNTSIVDVYYPRFNGDYLTQFLTYKMNISQNPIFCDCQLHVFVKALHQSLMFYMNVEENRVRCAGPPHLKGIDFFHDMELDEFVCNITTDCPSRCFCQERPNSWELFVDCRNQGLTSLPLTLPHAKYGNISLHLDNNNIEHLTKTTYSHYIRNLTISNNKLKSIDSGIIMSMNNSKFLNLDNNQINYIAKELQLLAFSNVGLSGNPLLCGCNMTWMADWINLSPDAKDSGITCDNDGESKLISAVTEDELFCSYDKLIIILSVTIGVIIGFVSVVVITAKRCPYETKVLLYKLFNIHPRDKYKVDQEPTKEYDAYISYYQGDKGESVQVRQWMKRVLLKKLEEKSKRKYTVFCYERDYDAGEFKSDEILKNMMKSRRILLILSPEFLNDDWCMFEADQAEFEHNSSGNVHGRVIYILWNKQMRIQLENEPWKSRLRDKRVMCPDDRLFWSKMRYELPVKTMRRMNRNATMPFSNGLTKKDAEENMKNYKVSVKKNRPNNDVTHMIDTDDIDSIISISIK
ncbi:protein toll-like [Argopecten irradians]|uniref:protein toll-like n=1 Tax=Argopecten irradians TaxID=31199 RepID=UPI00371C729F